MKRFNSSGQAVIEYIMMLSLAVLLAIRMSISIKDALTESFGVLADTISMHLTVGVCRDRCFFTNYKNGREQ